MTANATVTAVQGNFRRYGETVFDLLTVSLDAGGEYTNTSMSTEAGMIAVGDRVNVSDPVLPLRRRMLGSGHRTISRT